MQRAVVSLSLAYGACAVLHQELKLSLNTPVVSTKKDTRKEDVTRRVLTPSLFLSLLMTWKKLNHEPSHEKNLWRWDEIRYLKKRNDTKEWWWCGGEHWKSTETWFSSKVFFISHCSKKNFSSLFERSCISPAEQKQPHHQLDHYSFTLTTTTATSKIMKMRTHCTNCILGKASCRPIGKIHNINLCVQMYLGLFCSCTTNMKKRNPLASSVTTDSIQSVAPAPASLTDFDYASF